MGKFSSCYLERQRQKVTVELALSGLTYTVNDRPALTWQGQTLQVVCGAPGWAGSACRATQDTWARCTLYSEIGEVLRQPI